MKSTLKNLTKHNMFITVVILICLTVILSISSEYFLTGDNLLNVMNQSAVNGILALGLTFLLIAGSFDLSVGAVMGLSGVILGKALGLGFIPALLLAILTGVIVGIVNGLFITELRINPFIATLASQGICQGLALVISGASSQTGLPPQIQFLGKGKLFGVIPMPVAILIVLTAISWYVLKYTQFGRGIHYAGGNAEAARLSGINVKKMKLCAHIISSVAGAVAGIVLGARLNLLSAGQGTGYEMDAVSSAVIGGVGMGGGVGNPWGTLIGAIILGVIRNGLNLLNVNANWQKAVVGLILVVAVAVDINSKKRKLG